VHESFGRDVIALIEAIKAGRRARRKSPHLLWKPVAGALAIAAAAALLIIQPWPQVPAPTAADSLKSHTSSALARINTFDEKPAFVETYDYRLSHSKPVPPTLVDTFIEDVWQRLTMDLKLSDVTPKTVTPTQIESALAIYLSRASTQIAGFRPGTHALFVRSLTPAERVRLVSEIIEYARMHGVSDTK
jgi:hypothetical protein